MPAARYWRIARLETFAGGDLELSEVALYEGATRVDGAATFTSVVAPVSGSMSALSDVSFGTSVCWSGYAVRLPGFAVVCDFGSGVTKDVTSVGVAGPAQATFAHKFALEYSNDGASWATHLMTPRASQYPGPSAFWVLDVASAANDLAGLVVVQNDGAVTALRLEPSGLFAPFPFASAHTAGGRRLSISADGRFAAQADNSNTSDPRRLILYERSGEGFGELPRVDSYPEGYGRGAALTPSGDYVAVAIASSPYICWYKRNDLAFTRMAAPATLPTGNAEMCRWSDDGIYLAVAHATSPYVTIYKRSGDTLTKLANPATLPVGNGKCVAFSSDGTYMVVGGEVTPFVNIYKWDGAGYVKLPNPAVLPASGSESINDVAFDPTDSYLACGVQGSTKLVIYSRSGDTFTLHASPSVSSTPAPVSVAWFPHAATSPGLVSANYDASPLRAEHAEVMVVGEDVEGPTAAGSEAGINPIDVYDSGRGRIVGTVKEKNTPSNTPLMRRVVLLAMPGSRAIRETWSDPDTGAYEFAEVATDRVYTVVSYDHTGIYRGVVADNLTPEVMP